MPAPLARLDLSVRASDFHRLALEPGHPVLDSNRVHSAIVTRWLGRFAAVPEWHASFVHWHVEKEPGARVEDLPAETVAAADVRGPLRAEFEELQRQLAAVQPRNVTERRLHHLLTEQFRRATGPHPDIEPSTQFVKYQDGTGGWRLAWCWGYQPQDQSPIPAAICPACRNLFRLLPERQRTCPECKARLPVKRFPWVRAIAASVALIVALICAGGVVWYFSPRGVIEGLVLREADDRPLSGVSVSVGDRARTVTDAQGRFQLHRLPAGSAVVHAEAMGYHAAEETATLERGARGQVTIRLKGNARLVGRAVNGASRLPLPDTQISVVDGPWTTTSAQDGTFQLDGLPGGRVTLRGQRGGFPEHLLDVDLSSDGTTEATLQLTGLARLAGQVQSAISEQPIANAKVIMVGCGLETTTNAQGLFAFPQAPAGTVTLEISAAGFRTERVNKELVTEQDHSLRVVLAGGVSLAGRVVRAIDRQPLGGAEVRILGSKLAAKSDPEGLYKLTGLVPGTVSVQVIAPGFRSELAEVPLEPGSDTSRNFVLKGTAAVSGRVVDAQTQRPLRFAEVSVRGFAIKVKTDAKGTFHLVELPSHVARLDVVHAGYQDGQVALRLEEGQETSVEVQLAADGVLRGVVIDAATQAPLADATIEVQPQGVRTQSGPNGRFVLNGLRTGIVEIEVNAAGSEPVRLTHDIVSGKLADLVIPLAGKLALSGQVVHRLTGKPVPEATVAWRGTKARAKTDAEGRFRIERIRPGNVELDVVATGFAPGKLSVAVDRAETQMEIPLDGMAVVVGRVTDQLTGAGIAGAEVLLRGTRAKVTTDEEGRFRMEQLLGGPAEFEVAATGYPRVTSKLNVLPQNETTFATQLSGTAEVSGQVIDEEGLPVARAVATLAGTAYRVTADDQGRFQLRGCRAGTVALELSADGYATAEVSATLKMGEAVSLGTIRLESARALRGWVLNAATGEPIEGARIALVRGNRQAVTNREGRFQLDGVPPREFAARVAATGFVSEELQFTANNDRAASLIALCPELKPKEIRFVLTWANPRIDLDAHLYRVQPVHKHQHVWRQSPVDGTLRLELSSGDGARLETASFIASEAGKYELQVAARDLEHDAAAHIAAAQAVLKVYRHGDRAPKVFRARTDAEAEKPVWHPVGLEVKEGGELSWYEYLRNVYSVRLIKP
uniref:Carboxypeptidase regulatory-like domain-containing protein n=1 Tax=Schlesneria paludicola TaxID=360056 RepID=A0A7C4LIY6_9PLAN